jgi:hypothetical protein
MDKYLERSKNELNKMDSADLLHIVRSKENEYRIDSIELARKELVNRNIDYENLMYDSKSENIEKENDIPTETPKHDHIFNLAPRNSNFASILFIFVGIITFSFGLIYNTSQQDSSFRIVSGVIFVLLGLLVRAGYTVVVYIGFAL